MKALFLACLDVIAVTIVLVLGYFVAKLAYPGYFAPPTIADVAFMIAFIALRRQYKNGGAA
ncbi:hypothetical protein [Agrobacterium sp. DE0009]|uniref:hypothetical protein n=1 Tax=Agrobacterium sp. DE0009 TaxID=2587505 RepID=UPI0011A1B3AF|nr:hypothetical protein [Agrobacterium sp. DE0009]